MPTLLAAASENETAAENLLELIRAASRSPGEPVAVIAENRVVRGEASTISLERTGQKVLAAAIGEPLPLNGYPVLVDHPAKGRWNLPANEAKLPHSLGTVFGAAIAVDPDGLLVARDRLGSRPMFSSPRRDGELFSSEARVLRRIGCERIQTFPAGAARFAGKKRIEPIPAPRPASFPGTGKAVELLGKCLSSTIGTVPAPRAVFFSGGVDSLILAKISEQDADTVLVVAGVKGCKDFERAEAAARHLGSPLEKVEIDPAGLEAEVERLISDTGATDPLRLSISLPLLYAARRASDEGVRFALCGQGADELFGGYMKYLRSPRPAEHMYRDLLQIGDAGLVHCDLAARSQGIQMYFPFLEERVVTLALGTPLEQKISNTSRKVILRRLATSLGINKGLAETRKCAMQYGSGVSKHVLRIVRRMRNEGR